MLKAVPPHVRLNRAFDRGLLDSARFVAAECNRVDPEPAPPIVSLIRDQGPELFEPAAVRWAGQVMATRPALGFEGASELIAELEELGGPSRAVARSRLALLLRGIGEVRAAESLERSHREG